MLPHVARHFNTASAATVFAIDEVLRTILRHVQQLSRGPNRFRSSKYLLSCALTCQSFKEAALDQLWEDIPDFACLLYVWTADGLLDLSDASLWRYTRPLVENDWLRFDYHASRIKVVGLDISAVVRGAATRKDLAAQLSDDVELRASAKWPLLPRLTAVTVGLDSDVDLVQMALILEGCSALTTVTVKGSSKKAREWKEALEIVTAKTEGCVLRHLDFGAMQCFPRPDDEYGTAIYHRLFDLLERHPIRTASIPSSCLAYQELHRRLSLFDSLNTLNIEGEDDWDLPILPIMVQIDGPVTISSNASGLLRMCSSGVQWGSLTKIEVDDDSIHGGCIYWDDLRNLFLGLGTACPILEIFRMEWLIGVDDDPSYVERREASLLPLFSCSRLKSFSLCLHGEGSLHRDFNLTDEEWKRATESWTAMEVLIYAISFQASDTASMPSPESIPRASLMTVGHFASNCQRMEQLEIPVGNVYAAELGVTMVSFGGRLELLSLRASHINHNDQSNKELEFTVRFLTNVIRGNYGAEVVFPKPTHWNCGQTHVNKRHCMEWDLTVEDCFASMRR